jgi:hypothetical protein
MYISHPDIIDAVSIPRKRALQIGPLPYLNEF